MKNGLQDGAALGMQWMVAEAWRAGEMLILGRHTVGPGVTEGAGQQDVGRQGHIPG